MSNTTAELYNISTNFDYDNSTTISKRDRNDFPIWGYVLIIVGNLTMILFVVVIVIALKAKRSADKQSQLATKCTEEPTIIDAYTGLAIPKVSTEKDGNSSPCSAIADSKNSFKTKPGSPKLEGNSILTRIRRENTLKQHGEALKRLSLLKAKTASLEKRVSLSISLKKSPAKLTKESKIHPQPSATSSWREESKKSHSPSKSTKSKRESTTTKTTSKGGSSSNQS